MEDSTTILGSIVIAIFILGVFVSFVVVCGVANAREIDARQSNLSARRDPVDHD